MGHGVAHARSPKLLAVGAFLFLWNFNPFSSTVLYVHMTRELGFSEQFYGSTVSLDAAAAVAASVCFGLYCRRVPPRWLVHLSITSGILATVAYWGLAGRASAVFVTLLVGFTYMTACLAQYDLAARACPPAVAGTVFAVLMALTNLSNGLSTAAGGYLYEMGIAWWGSRVAFNVLVGVGALFTAGCWFLVPQLTRQGAAPAGADWAHAPSGPHALQPDSDAALVSDWVVTAPVQGGGGSR